MSARSYGSDRKLKIFGTRSERLRPDRQGARRPLLHEHKFPIVITQAREAAIVRKIEKFGGLLLSWPVR
jgi:hypothetical protein